MNATSAIIPRLLDRPHEKTEVVESGSIGQLSLSGSPGESGRRSLLLMRDSTLDLSRLPDSWSPDSRNYLGVQSGIIKCPDTFSSSPGECGCC